MIMNVKHWGLSVKLVNVALTEKTNASQCSKKYKLRCCSKPCLDMWHKCKKKLTIQYGDHNESKKMKMDCLDNQDVLEFMPIL